MFNTFLHNRKFSLSNNEKTVKIVLNNEKNSRLHRLIMSKILNK